MTSQDQPDLNTLAAEVCALRAEMAAIWGLFSWVSRHGRLPTQAETLGLRVINGGKAS